MLCAHRVIAHRRAFKEINRGLRGRSRSVDYLNLVQAPEIELARVFTEAERISLGEFILAETPRRASLDKFRDVLNGAQLAEIEALENETSGADP